MPQTLFATVRSHDEAIALPVFRIGAVLDGMLDQPSNRDTARALLDLFAALFAADLAFMMEAGRGGKPGSLAPFKPARLSDWRARIAEGLPRNRGLRLYGTDATPLGAPFAPYFSVDHDRHPLTRIEICLPHDTEGLAEIAEAADGILRMSQMRFGVQGFAFAGSPAKVFPETMLPPAFRRYRAAMMGDVMGKDSCLFYSRPWVAMRRQDQKRRGDRAAPYDYEPGIPDMGWRTYVGATFAERLDPGDPNGAVTLARNDRMTVVTAGERPIWGDLNLDEGIEAFHAARAFLVPAFASRNILSALTLGADPAHPASVEQTQAYLDRLA